MQDKPEKKAPRTLRLNARDNVIVAVDSVEPGVTVQGVKAATRVMRGHKMSAQKIDKGQPILKFGQIIGFATEDIAPGSHVHTHNCSFATFERDYAFAQDAREEALLPPEARATFEGFRRANGKAGTRNYIGILTSVNCSASVARFMAEAVNKSGILEQYPNVDGVVSFVHGTGCGLAAKGEGYEALERTQWGYAGHPQPVGGAGGGPGLRGVPDRAAQGEVRPDRGRQLPLHDHPGHRRYQEDHRGRCGAYQGDVAPRQRGTRETISASELMLALQCGGSDGYSGITANPALGAAVDLLVRHGGTAVLSETPEIYGAEHLLTRRARSRQVGEKLVDIIRWWEAYCAKNDGSMDNNPSPGNKAGGLTTILEKSLGAAAKGGTTTLTEVYHYAEPVTAKGFVYMDTPGLRSGGGHGPSGRRLQRAVLHDGARLGLRLQADALHQARHQPRHLQAHAGRHGHQLRGHPGRRDDRAEGQGDLRAHSAHGLRREDQERAARLRRQRVRPLADRRDDVGLLSRNAPRRVSGTQC
jgi:altronate hydrolase